MKRASLFWAAGILLLISGCATSFRPWQLDEMNETMSGAQVLQLLGEPDSRITASGTNYLYYSYTENLSDSFDSHIDDDLSRQADRFRSSFNEYTYEVWLVNDRLAGYRRIAD
jgi:hypothetical protein